MDPQRQRRSPSADAPLRRCSANVGLSGAAFSISRSVLRAGSYHIGKDIHEVRQALRGWGETAERMLAVMPDIAGDRLPQASVA